MDHSQHMMHHPADSSSHHSGHSAPAAHSMAMTFHGGFKELILFDQWNTQSIGAFIGSWFLIFFIGILYEGLKTVRDYLAKREAHPQSRRKTDQQSALVGHADEPLNPTETLPRVQTENAPTKCSRLLNGQHIIQSVLHILQMGISYLLMLIAMTYNTYLFFAVILGAGVGHFLFAWRRSSVIDHNEHCH